MAARHHHHLLDMVVVLVVVVDEVEEITCTHRATEEIPTTVRRWVAAADHHPTAAAVDHHPTAAAVDHRRPWVEEEEEELRRPTAVDIAQARSV
jgi:hypothetical protein